MPDTLQDFLADATPRAAASLAEALLRLPEDRRAWSPEGKARPALDLVAECALLNGSTADMIRSRTWPDADYAEFFRVKDETAALEWDRLKALLDENTRRAVEAIREVPDADLGIEVAMPWGKQTLASIMAYPYWNMTYHEGQINYIASMLGCLG